MSFARRRAGGAVDTACQDGQGGRRASGGACCHAGFEASADQGAEGIVPEGVMVAASRAERDRAGRKKETRRPWLPAGTIPSAPGFRA